MTNTHWTEDSELLEQYVLGRLDPKQLPEFEKHLASCQQCASAVREEQALAAGVRRMAREELKAGLRERLETENVREVPWLRLAAAAAVIVVLVGVGVYNDWFSRFTQKYGAEEAQPQHPTSVAPEELRRASPQAEEEQRDRATQSGAVRQRPTSETAQGPSRERLPAAEGHEYMDESSGAGARSEADKLEAAKKSETALAMDNERALWTEGKILSYEHGETSGAPSPAEMRRQTVTVRPELQKQADENQAREKGTQEKSVPQRFILQQRRTTELPAGQTRREGSVPTLIEQTRDGLQFTLYLDRTTSARDLHRAQFETIREDSLVLILGSQRIGYRLPSGWLTQSPTQRE